MKLAVKWLAFLLATLFDSPLPWGGAPHVDRRSRMRALVNAGIVPVGGEGGVVTADDLKSSYDSAVTLEAKRTEATRMLKTAQEWAEAGRGADAAALFEQAKGFITDLAKAEQTAEAAKSYAAGLTKPQNTVPVVSGERDLYDPNDNARHYRSSHEPLGYIKSLPSAIQVKWVREQMGDDQKAAADAYKRAFAMYMQAPRKLDTDVAILRWMEGEDSAAVRALEEGTDAEGGYWVPEDWRDEVLHDPGAPGAVHRPLCSVIRTSRDTGYLPTIDSPDSAASLGEEAAITGNETDPTFGQVQFTIFKFTNLVRVSTELLEDEAYGLPAWITQIHREAFDRHEDNQVIVGDGTTEHQGLRTASVSDTTMANATSIVAADVHELYWTFPSQFRGNARVSTSSSLMHQLMGIGATAAGQHFVENLAVTPPNTFLGLPTALFDGTGWDDATAIATGEELGAIGDFRRYYLIDRVGLSIRRLNELYAGNDQVGFYARKRGDGRVGLTNAFRILKAA